MVAKMIKKMMDDPEGMHGFFLKMLSQFGVDTLRFAKYLEKSGPKSGIITARNELMSAKAIQMIIPENGCILIRFGMGHSEGMIEELTKSDC
ncbi:MAG: hypothetical protein WBP29_08370 [Candidatus Zixiibacteriota bacterium]